MAFWDIFHPENKLARALTRLSDALSGSLLTAVCCLPVLSSGSAVCALYTQSFRRLRLHEDGSVRGFFSDLKHNLKNGCVFTLLWAGFLALSVLWLIFLQKTQLTALQIPVFVVIFFGLEVLEFALPVSAVLQPKPALALRICLFLALKAPWYAFLKLACLAGLVVLGFVLPIGMRYWLVPLLLIGGIYWVNYLFCSLFARIIKKHLPQAKTRLDGHETGVCG